jgi:hypothetical protein
MRPSASILLLLSGTAFFLVGGVQFALSPHVARAQGQGERPLLDGRTGKPTIPPTLIALPGEFAIETVHPGIYDGFYLTAVGGGGQTTDVIHTDAKQIRSWERFRLSSDTNGSEYAVQTATGNYLTAVDGGGRIDDVIHTDATQVNAWEKFRLWDAPPSIVYIDLHFVAIQTVSGNYLTAVGGGGKIVNAIHTDATTIGTWERFWLWKCGDVGSGYQYAVWNPMNGYFLVANAGGGRITSVFSNPSPDFPREWGRFTLIQQNDGTYAIQTASGNYLTAVGGGGLAHGTAESDNLHTDATWVRAWEKFRLVDQGDCTYTIQTASGYYLGPGPAGISTDISDVRAATRFRLSMTSLLSGT